MNNKNFNAREYARKMVDRRKSDKRLPDCCKDDDKRKTQPVKNKQVKPQ